MESRWLLDLLLTLIFTQLVNDLPSIFIERGVENLSCLMI